MPSFNRLFALTVLGATLLANAAPMPQNVDATDLVLRAVARSMQVRDLPRLHSLGDLTSIPVRCCGPFDVALRLGCVDGVRDCRAR
jgi:hypothetical protein